MNIFDRLRINFHFLYFHWNYNFKILIQNVIINMSDRKRKKIVLDPIRKREIVRYSKLHSYVLSVTSTDI